MTIVKLSECVSEREKQKERRASPRVTELFIRRRAVHTGAAGCEVNQQSLAPGAQVQRGHAHAETLTSSEGPKSCWLSNGKCGSGTLSSTCRRLLAPAPTKPSCGASETGRERSRGVPSRGTAVSGATHGRAGGQPRMSARDAVHTTHLGQCTTGRCAAGRGR